MDYRKLITIEPGKRSGQPCIRGMRITVRDVLEYLAGGMSIDEVLADFPELTVDDIRRVSGVRGQPNPTAGGVSLLFDQNLSWRLPLLLKAEYPDSQQVNAVGLSEANDLAVWSYAQSKRLAVVSKDKDFLDLAASRGTPPKLIWMRIGNGPTRQIETLLRSRQADVAAFLADSAAGVLILP